VATICGEAPGYWAVISPAGAWMEGSSSCFSANTEYTPNPKIASVISPTISRFARLSLVRCVMDASFRRNPWVSPVPRTSIVQPMAPAVDSVGPTVSLTQNTLGATDLRTGPR
jgi:hypothetical protein